MARGATERSLQHCRRRPGTSAGSTKPAAVSGAAVGIGTTLLMHCDMVYAAHNAKFPMPFSQQGLCPETASNLPLPLPQLAGFPRATKSLMKRSRTAAINETMGAENALFGAMLLAPEAKEAFAVFFEKRKPNFSKFA